MIIQERNGQLRAMRRPVWLGRLPHGYIWRLLLKVGPCLTKP
jgi:hypothetical protein